MSAAIKDLGFCKEVLAALGWSLFRSTMKHILVQGRVLELMLMGQCELVISGDIITIVAMLEWQCYSRGLQ